MKNKSDKLLTIFFILVLVFWLALFATALTLKLTNSTFSTNVSWFWVWFCLWFPVAIVGLITVLGVLCAVKLGAEYDKYTDERVSSLDNKKEK